MFTSRTWLSSKKDHSSVPTIPAGWFRWGLQSSKNWESRYQPVLVWNRIFYPISMAISGTDSLEVPTIYKAYFLGLCKGIYPQNIAMMIQSDELKFFRGVGTCWNHQPESNGMIEGLISHCSAGLLASWKNPRWKPLWTTWTCPKCQVNFGLHTLDPLAQLGWFGANWLLTVTLKCCKVQ